MASENLKRVIECVPNFSEGRDARVLADLASAVQSSARVQLLDYSADADHHRSVFTFTGAPLDVVTAALAAVRVACDRIDLNRHVGVHPRIGAADVVPFVPLHHVDMEECVRLSRYFGEQLWQQLRIPVFFYEQAALRPEHRQLDHVRRLAREGAPPDIGDGRHPTAGACAVGARFFLIAWNIWLETADLELARQIARAIRFSSGGFPAVKAMGLPLGSQGMVQVSINSVDFRITPLDVVFEKVRELADQAGVKLRGSELIGMIPRAALAASRDLSWLNLSEKRVLD